MTKLDRLAQEILADVLADFQARNLGAAALRNGYVGASLPAIMEKHRAAGASQVDFDLSMKELETGKLVSTGPMEPFKNDPNSSVVVIALFSKREYVYLTEKGYRAAQQAKTPVKPASRSSVHISGGTFHHSPIGVGDRVTQSVNVNVENQSEAVEALLQLLARTSVTIDDAAKGDVEQLVEMTGSGNLAGAKPIFQKLFGGAVEGVKQVAWGVVSTIVAKQLGF